MSDITQLRQQLEASHTRLIDATVREAREDAQRWRTSCIQLEVRIFEMTQRETALLARIKELEAQS